MYCTQENAQVYVGRKLFANRPFHYYPLKIVKSDGIYYYVDRNGVKVKIPSERESAIYFEWVEPNTTNKGH